MRKLLWIPVLVLLFFAVAGQDGPVLPCCRMVQLRMTGSASDNQNSRSGLYRQMKTMEYHQVEGKNYLYRWSRKAWYFGVDNHTSGLQSEPTMECPDRARNWRFWSVNGDQEQWSNFQNDEISVTCVNEDQMPLNSSLEDEGSFPLFQYSTNDGPNVQCSTLNKTDPGYPPHPRIVLLGASGVGKSSLGNQLLGCYKNEKDCQAFSVGHSSSSKTNETSWVVGNYLGKGGCVTLVDTPGASDSEGRDYDHALDMAKVLRNDLKSVDVFLLMFNGKNLRFLGSIKKLLKLYVSIFSDDLWKHAITEITYWKWDEDQVEDRLDEQNINATLKHEQWNGEYREQLNVTDEVPTVFVDPVFPIFSKDKKKKEKIKRQPEAVEKFVHHTSKLWSLANKMPEFHCQDRCEAPQGYFSGAPWVVQPIAKGRLGTSQTSSCQIWKGIHGDASTKNVKWKFNGITIFEKKTETNFDKISTHINPKWLDKITVTEKDNDHFSEFQLILQYLDKETQGNYHCENGKTSGNIPENNLVEMVLIEDGSWSSWMPWSKCSISCRVKEDDLGIQKRKRECIPPKNGGMQCVMSESEETRDCAHKTCPVDCEWNAWGRWITPSCSLTCGGGIKIKKRTRSYRTQSLEGGKQCSGDFSETEIKSCNTAVCPVDCKWSAWGSWIGSSCSVTCGGGFQVQERARSYKTQSAGTGKQCSGFFRETRIESCNTDVCSKGICTAGLKWFSCKTYSNGCQGKYTDRNGYNSGKAKCWCQCCSGNDCGEPTY